jgi:ABC-type transport system involved in multi-copper enzyme maturation permease subunit
MMGKVLAIGLNTFREAVRNKVLYSLLFFAVAVIVASLAFGALSVHEEVRLTTDLGLAGMSLFSVIIAIFVGVNLVYKELERKTIYSLIPKPIHRYQFVLGKFIGMVVTLGVQIAVMTAVLLVVLKLQGGDIGSAVPKMIVLIFLEVVVVTAIAVFFSSFSTPFLSGLFTVGVFLVGRSVPDIKQVVDRMDNRSLAGLLGAVARVVPDLRFLYVTGAETPEGHISVHGLFPDWSYVGVAGLYALLYVAVVLLLAIALFSRRDFI